MSEKDLANLVVPNIDVLLKQTEGAFTKDEIEDFVNYCAMAIRDAPEVEIPKSRTINKDIARGLHLGQTIYHRAQVTQAGAVRAKVTGQCKTWKRATFDHPEGDFRLPVKHGLYESFYITPANGNDWSDQNPDDFRELSRGWLSARNIAAWWGKINKSALRLRSLQIIGVPMVDARERSMLTDPIYRANPYAFVQIFTVESIHNIDDWLALPAWRLHDKPVPGAWPGSGYEHLEYVGIPAPGRLIKNPAKVISFQDRAPRLRKARAEEAHPLIREARQLIRDIKREALAQGGRDHRYLTMYEVKNLFRGAAHTGELDTVPALAVGQADDLVFEHIDRTPQQRVGSFRIWRSRVGGPPVSMEVLVDGRWVLHEAD